MFGVVKKKLLNKDFLRFLINLISLFIFNIFFFIKFLINDENLNIFLNFIFSDVIRFLKLQVDIEILLFVFLFLVSLVLDLAVSTTKWYQNPQLFKLSSIENYFKIFQITSLVTVFIFFFLRVFNISRFSFGIYLLLIPLIFLLFQSGGLFSKHILRQHNDRKYILVNLDNILKNEIFIDSIIVEDNKIQDCKIIDYKKAFQEISKLQKTQQFDFIVLSYDKISKKIVELIFNLSNLKKQIYVFSNSSFESKEINKLIINRIENNFLDIFIVNSKVQDGIEFILKRTIDIIVSLFLIVLLLPIFLLISLLIYFQDFHSPIIQIPRSGLYGNNFNMYKFRTMYQNSHSQRNDLNTYNKKSGPLFKIDNDPRIIKNLNWLRKYSLDELPQLFNVVMGHMSIVGPRPLFEEDLELFRDEETIRLSVLPGITGLLQIKDRETEDFNVWFKYDKQYIESWSIWLDLKIMLLTPFKIKMSK